MSAAGTVLGRAQNVLHHMENGFLLLLIVSAVLLSTTQIVLRNLNADALIWADQALNISVLWIAMAGALVASREKNHIAIDLLSRYTTGLAQRLVQATTHLATALCCGIVAWFGTHFVIEEREYGEIAFLNIPIWVCEAIIPFTLAIIAIRYASYFFSALSKPS